MNDSMKYLDKLWSEKKYIIFFFREKSNWILWGVRLWKWNAWYVIKSKTLRMIPFKPNGYEIDQYPLICVNLAQVELLQEQNKE